MPIAMRLIISDAKRRYLLIMSFTVSHLRCLLLVVLAGMSSGCISRNAGQLGIVLLAPEPPSAAMLHIYTGHRLQVQITLNHVNRSVHSPRIYLFVDEHAVPGAGNRKHHFGTQLFAPIDSYFATGSKGSLAIFHTIDFDEFNAFPERDRVYELSAAYIDNDARFSSQPLYVFVRSNREAGETPRLISASEFHAMRNQVAPPANPVPRADGYILLSGPDMDQRTSGDSEDSQR